MKQQKNGNQQQSRGGQSDPTRAEKPQPGQQSDSVEGEGSYTATQRYNAGLKEHLETHDVEEEAETARRALEGEERKELEDAEKRAKRGPPAPQSKDEATSQGQKSNGQQLNGQRRPQPSHGKP